MTTAHIAIALGCDHRLVAHALKRGATATPDGVLEYLRRYPPGNGALAELLGDSAEPMLRETRSHKSEDHEHDEE